MGQTRLLYLVMQIKLLTDVCTHSQRVLRAGGFFINYLRGAPHQKHASSTIEGNEIMNTMTRSHLQGGVAGAGVPLRRSHGLSGL